MKNKKILLYIKKGNKKVILSYPDEKDFLILGGDMEIIENGFVPDVNEVYERWEIEKVTKNKNKLTMDFKLIIRKNT